MVCPCFVAWTGLSEDCEDQCRRYRYTVDEDTLTEWAAIGMMGLLIHHLEGGIIRRVIRKGSGGDYLVTLTCDHSESQVEVSGIHRDESNSGSDSSARLREKREQILRYCPAGFISVTTFAHGTDREVRSFLHYVQKPTLPRSRTRKKRVR